MSSLVTDLNNSAVEEIVNWVTTADGCVVYSRRRDTTQLDFAVGKFVQTRRDCRASPTSCEFRTHRRRDSSRQLSRVGVGGVYWALEDI